MKLSTTHKLLITLMALLHGSVSLPHDRDLHEGFDSTFINNTQHLAKRWPISPIDDTTWDQLICRGNNLHEMMITDDAHAAGLFDPPLTTGTAASEWTNWPSDFTRWGWTPGRVSNLQCYMDNSGYGIENALSGLGITKTVPPMKCRKVEHGTKSGREVVNNQKYYVDRKEYRATGGDYAFFFNAAEGFAGISKQYSPSNEASQRVPPVTELPKLRRCSDILYGEWVEATRTANSDIKNIKYVMVWSMSNSISAPAVAKALEVVGKPLENWPGTQFDIDDPEGRAMLGTPNGLGVAYFLIQHKAELGRKTITKVDVFAHESTFKGRDPCFVFHIEDV